MYKIILETVVGSTACGTNLGPSDLDVHTVILEDVENFLGLRPERINGWARKLKKDRNRPGYDRVDWTAHGLKRYIGFVLKNNPSALTPLFVSDSDVREQTQEGKELRGLVPSIVCKNAYRAFLGHMNHHRKQIDHYDILVSFKHAYQVVRLALQGCELLKTGRITLPMSDEYRQLLVDIRKGKYTQQELLEHFDVLELKLILAYKESPLPDKPDVDRVEEWTQDTYLSNWTNK